MIHGRKVIGIIGGMGPMATADLFIKIIENTKADKDQEHLHILIDNNTDIPDRTEHILIGSDAPLIPMAESAARLEAQGADVLIMPCNSAHHYYDGLCRRTDLPVLNMPELTAKTCEEQGIRCAALLATEGCIRSGIYDPYFEARGIQLLKPSEDGIRALMYVIYEEVKAGKRPHPEFLYPEMERLKAKGAEVFLLACTELPLAFNERTPFVCLDPTLVLAKAAITAAGGMLKNG
ncbi:MAG: amino acid racemase [Lachnospiraceae bacterium]|nr:amino acid racemase [Lachnospiraceae bacterium]